MSSWPMLLLLVGMLAVAGRDALLDRSPRKPWAWKRPDLEWWAHRRTRREKATMTSAMSAPMVAGSHPFRRFLYGHLPTRRRASRTGR